MQGSGFGVPGLGFGVWGLGLGLGVWCLCDLRFRVKSEGSKFGVWCLNLNLAPGVSSPVFSSNIGTSFAGVHPVTSPAFGVGVEILVCRDRGLGFRGWGLGLRLWGSGFGCMG